MAWGQEFSEQINAEPSRQPNPSLREGMPVPTGETDSLGGTVFYID